MNALKNKSHAIIVLKLSNSISILMNFAIEHLGVLTIGASLGGVE
jgi:hypothetical protein